MSKNEKQLQDAQLKTVESIQEYLNDFHSVGEMYERSAKALAALMHVSPKLAPEAKAYINDMVQDHICLLDLLQPLNEKGGDVC